ncbi:hypothetical protein SY88_02275 [Clostridiales bacterium PH28_bin88]|nr:hypothetical protein SY88_02275 [Clostridiales bacterium PH28_bin88]
MPKEIRAALELDEGDRVLLKLEPGGRVVLEKAIIVAAGKKNDQSPDREIGTVPTSLARG